MLDHKKREKKFYKLSELATAEQIQWFESLFDKLKLRDPKDPAIKYKMIIENDLGVEYNNFYWALYALLADHDEPVHFSCANIVIADTEEELEKLKNKEIY